MRISMSQSISQIAVGVIFLCTISFNNPLFSADNSKAINTICPVTGQPINSAIAPIIITTGKGERSQRVLIGVADAQAAEKVKANPTAYIAAAKANKKAE
jgi:adenosine/AMP kinase